MRDEAACPAEAAKWTATPMASGLTPGASGRLPMLVQRLEPPDSHHLDAAVGWLGLDCAAEAQAELDQISAARQKHPDVLEARWTLCAREKRWGEALEIARAELAAAPGDCAGWLHRAYALRRIP